MKYKVGDKVRIRRNLSADELNVNDMMISFAGSTATITKVYNDGVACAVDIDKGDWVWHGSMLEDVDETDETDKTVNPDYYKFHGYDVFDIADYFGLSFPLGNALKYLLRAGKKDSATWEQDLSKCKKCIERAMEMKENGKE
jgi:hypothetical protein